MSVDEAKIINQTISRLLSKRENSHFELLQKLALKGFSSAPPNNVNYKQKHVSILQYRGFE